jgi:hypothetical protein
MRVTRATSVTSMAHTAIELTLVANPRLTPAPFNASLCRVVIDCKK